MRDPKRIKRILKLLDEYWDRPGNHDLRLAQIIGNFSVGLLKKDSRDTYHFEDDDFEECLEQELKKSTSLTSNT